MRQGWKERSGKLWVTILESGQESRIFFLGGGAHSILVPCLGIESLNYWTLRVLGLESVFFSTFYFVLEFSRLTMCDSFRCTAG